jgi:ACS family hexuronate transporter-like MFS transporter
MVARTETRKLRWTRKLPGLRWYIAAAILLVSILNYLDRQTLSILATTIQRDLGLTTIQYGYIVQSFLLAYTLFHLLGGRIVDALGVRVAETTFILWWSAANMLTGLSTGFAGLLACRTLLGIGEPGHYSASGKAISEWFPARERAIAVGMLTMGGTLGAALAGPLVAALASHYGWRSVFFLTGVAGLLPAVLWYFFYRRPVEHPLLSDAERSLLAREGVLSAARPNPAKLKEVLAAHPLWLILAARMLTDPIWHFYLNWFPKYLQEARSLSLLEVGATLWVVFLAADLGSLAGGWFSGFLIRRGEPETRARLLVMSGCAGLFTLSFLMPSVPGKWGAIALASVFTFAEMAWMTNCVTLPIDIFPSRMVGSVQGLIGAGGSLGGFAATGLTAWIVSQFGFSPAFFGMAVLHAAAILTLWFFLPGAIRAWRPAGTPSLSHPQEVLS